METHEVGLLGPCSPSHGPPKSPKLVLCRPLIARLHLARLLQLSRSHHVFAAGVGGVWGHVGGAPWALCRYLTGFNDPCGGWVLLGGGRPVLLQPGQQLTEYEAERGIPGDCSFAFACPEADPWASGMPRLKLLRRAPVSPRTRTQRAP